MRPANDILTTRAVLHVRSTREEGTNDKERELRLKVLRIWFKGIERNGNLILRAYECIA